VRPKGRSYLEESDYWDSLSLDELLEGSEPVDIVFVDRRPPKQMISLRVDAEVITAAKRIARKMGLGYQTLFRMWVVEGLSRYNKQVPKQQPRARPRKRTAA